MLRRAALLLLAASFVLAAAPLPAQATSVVCKSSAVATATPNAGGATFHYDITAKYLCVTGATGYLSVTDDFESVFFFDSCSGQLTCELHTSGDAPAGDCVHAAAFTVGSRLADQNDSQKACG